MDPEGAAARPWRPTLTLVLTLGFGGLMAAALLAVAFVTLSVSQRNTTELLREVAVVTLDGLVRAIEGHIGAAERQVAFLAEQVERGRLDPDDGAQLAATIRGALAAAPQVRGLAFFDDDGRLTRSGYVDGGLHDRAGRWTERPLYARFVELVRSGAPRPPRPVVWVDELGAPQVAVDAAVYDGERFEGVFSALVSITELSRFIAELATGDDLRAFVLHGRERVLAHPALAGGLRGVSPEALLPGLGDVQDPVLAAIWQAPSESLEWIGEGTGLKGHIVELSGKRYIFIYREITGWSQAPWIVGVYLSSDVAGVTLRRLVVSGVTALGIVALSVLLAVLFGRAVARPIRRLAEASSAVTRFRLDEAPRLRGGPFRELAQAASAYNTMLGTLRRVETYVPRSLVLRLMRLGPAAARSEQREVSVMFTDIIGFTGLSERMSADELAAFLNDHFARLGACIDAEEGTVDKYIGDSVMAFWGAPEAQPDHAERACRAALAIARSLAAANRRRQAAGRPMVRLRIGVHSGPAVVGNIGAPGRVDYTLVGDTVNTAQRLEALGDDHPLPDEAATILISGETAARLDGGFVLQRLGTIRLRGRSAEIEVTRLLATAP